MKIDISSRELQLNIKKMVAKRVSSPEDQDDIVQEIFLKIIKYAKLEQSSSFFAWLKLTVRSCIGDYYRKVSRRLPVDDSADFEMPDETVEINNDLIRCIHPFLNSMSSSDANLIKKIDLNGESQKKLAKKMDVKYSTLKSRLQKARKILANKISVCCFDGNTTCC